MTQYLDLLRLVLDHGKSKADRTGTGTYAVFGAQARYPLAQGFPLPGQTIRLTAPQGAHLEAGTNGKPIDSDLWAAQFISYEHPGTWLNSGGLGTMGYAVPAAMGAKVGRPDAVVWAIDGDGCFQMTNQELATCAVEGIPIKVAVINNGNLGMVRQWQTLFYGQRYSNTDLGTHKHRIPDFVKLAEALGCVGLRCETAGQLDATLEAAMNVDDQPVVIDFVVGKDAMVWPMVPAGTSNDEIQFARGVRPIFDEDDV